MPREFSPYERTHLARYNVPHHQLLFAGSTPVEYLSGWVEFGGLEFEVSPDVLIPRVDSEELVRLAVTHLHELSDHHEHPLMIADVGTGSGALGLSIWHQLNQLGVKHTLLASDISALATAVATRNHQRLSAQAHLKTAQPQGPVAIFTSDLLDKYPTDWRGDVIVANLPYIPQSRLAHLPSSVRHHEPPLALDGGTDGLRLIARLLNQARSHIQPHGLLLLEIDDTHTQRALNHLHPDWEITILTDHSGRNRYAIAQPQ